ncbi:hypothetical protein N2603_08685 [Bradyrhizobium huanghuaihaiense]|uniref:hypothetical protein n=1 Tax=Bradyrhizobium huanghuaihaiense TaxID=990078 RepID=UPI0021AAEE5D|nr:hypothetical protein [Bradyrhizobium sp. CB3035]UWU78513.1 hypothetical protein N2603_08685 [Bradyrhizobium sp. CB3035]
MTPRANFTYSILVFGILISGSCTSSAGCDVSGYDQTPPAKIVDNVNNGTIHFEWASDVDVRNDRRWVWHYIKNTDQRGLSYKWPKADLRRALGNPLEPNGVDCNRYVVTGSTALDDNAPITFGTNETTQRAAVFAETKTASTPSTASIVDTSYRTSSGTIEAVHVALWTDQGKTDQDRWRIVFERTSNAKLALAIPSDLSSEQYTSLSKQLGSGGPIKLDSKALRDLYSEQEIDSRSQQQYLVLAPPARDPKSVAIVPASALRQVSSDLILMDREDRLFFATTIRLLVPANSAR